MKFGFIAKHRGIWPVSWLCGALDVSRSGFHAWLVRAPRARSRSDKEYAGKIRASFISNVWDNAAMESFFSSLKTERIARKTSRTRNQARQDVFDYIERFYNPTRRHSTLGYLSPMDFEKQAHVA